MTDRTPTTPFVPTAPVSASATRRLRITVIIALALVALQVLLGGAVAAQMTALQGIHAVVAYTLFLVSIVAAVFARGHAKVTGKKGVFFHALSIPILMVVQIGLGSMRVTIVHIVLGLAIAVAIGALYAMIARVPAQHADVDLVEE
jgi:heme A synthase